MIGRFGKNIKDFVIAIVSDSTKRGKITNPSVSRGSTAVPRKPSEKQRFGFRLDYDGDKMINNVKHHLFKLQANAEAEDQSIKDFIKAQGKKGTHTVIATVAIPESADEEQVRKSLDEGLGAWYGVD
jgi:hypothetical protein